MSEERKCADRAFVLADGRRLAYSEWGPGDGAPVLAFHGLPNSRLVHFRDAPSRQGVRLLLLDRPGFGRSDPHPGRSLLGWAGDVEELAGALGLERFAVLGISAGGPHAEACAWALPARVGALGIVSAAGPVSDVPAIADGLPPPWVELAALARTDRPAAEALAHRLCADDLDLLHRDPERWLREWEATAPIADRELIADPDVRAMYVDSCSEATLAGYVEELMLLTAEPWGFALEDIRVPSLLWHGMEDATVPAKVAAYAAAAIPGCEATLYPDEGHLLVHAHEDEILSALARALRRGA